MLEVAEDLLARQHVLQAGADAFVHDEIDRDALLEHDLALLAHRDLVRDAQRGESNGESGEDFSGLGNTSLGIYRLADAGVHNITAPTYSLHTDVGYLARVIYSFNNRYHFNASFRRDGSSVFGSEHKWGNFPAVGAAWTISDESFMAGTHNWLDYLKLKNIIKNWKSTL